MFSIIIFVALAAFASAEGSRVGEPYDEGFAVAVAPVIRSIGQPVLYETDRDRGRLLCATGCVSAYQTYTIEHNFVLSGQDCDDAKYDPRYLQKRTVEEGRRFTGVFNGWKCEMRRDPSCPKSYEYYAFMTYGCEERNGTKYWITHTYEKLHELLMQM